jgi:hypothetical protein
MHSTPRSLSALSAAVLALTADLAGRQR